MQSRHAITIAKAALESRNKHHQHLHIIESALATGARWVRDMLLLVGLYCGIPPAIEAHQIAAEIFNFLPILSEMRFLVRLEARRRRGRVA
jgi:hypothetical protein